MDLFHLLFAERRVGLKQLKPNDRLGEIFRGKHVHPRVVSEGMLVGRLNHPRVLILHGGDVPFERSDFRVGVGHGTLERPDFGLVVPDELLAQIHAFVHQSELDKGVFFVRGGLVEEFFGGGDFGLNRIALFLQVGLVLSVGTGQASKHRDARQDECAQARLKSRSAAHSLRGFQKGSRTPAQTVCASPPIP